MTTAPGEPRTASTRGIARAGATDALRLIRDVLLPTMGKGVLRRRPRVVGLLDRTGIEERGIRRLQALRQAYGPHPVLVSLLGRKQLILTDPEDMLRVLRETPATFLSTSDEKSAALAHFEPGASLISTAASPVAWRASSRRPQSRMRPAPSTSSPITCSPSTPAAWPPSARWPFCPRMRTS